MAHWGCSSAVSKGVLEQVSILTKFGVTGTTSGLASGKSRSKGFFVVRGGRKLVTKPAFQPGFENMEKESWNPRQKAQAGNRPSS